MQDDGATQSSDESNFVNLNVSYEILERPKIRFDIPIEFDAKDVATLNITFQNNEESNVTVVGLTGSVIDAVVGYEVANVSAQELGPFVVPVNESVSFEAPIQLTLPEGSFILAPILYVVKSEELMKVGIRPFSIFISPPPMSFFNPGFLSIQVLLSLVVIGSAYLVINFRKQGNRKPKRSTAQAKPVDDSWLPDVHKN